MLRGMILLKYAMIYVILIEFSLMKKHAAEVTPIRSRGQTASDKSSDSKVEMDLSSRAMLFDTHANRLDKKLSKCGKKLLKRAIKTKLSFIECAEAATILRERQREKINVCYKVCSM